MSPLRQRSLECIGQSGSAAKCQKDGRQSPDGDIVDETGREPIEQMHVVHRQDDRPTLGSALQILAQNTQQVHLVDIVQIARKKVSERTEREWPHRFRSGNPLDVVVRRPTQNLTNQAGLSDSSLSGDGGRRIDPGPRWRRR